MSCNRGVNYFVYNDVYIDNDKQYPIFEKNNLLEIGKEEPIDESNKRLVSLYRTLDLYVMKNNKLIENKHGKIYSKILSETSKSDMVTVGGVYPYNILDFNVHFDNLHAIDVYYAFDIKTESVTDINSIKVVTQINNSADNENKYYMAEDIFGDFCNNSEWTHFKFHHVYNNSICNFNENNKMIVYIYNPDDIQKIMIKNFVSKVVINSY